MLQQLEQSLTAEDPDFASTLSGSKLLANNRRNAALAGLGFVVGLVVLFAGAVSAITWLGILGFLTMLGAGYAFATAWRRGIAGEGEQAVSSGPSGPRGGSSRNKPSGSFVDRMEERWQRRQNDDGF